MPFRVDNTGSPAGNTNKFNDLAGTQSQIESPVESEASQVPSRAVPFWGAIFYAACPIPVSIPVERCYFGRMNDKKLKKAQYALSLKSKELPVGQLAHSPVSQTMAR